MAEANRPVEIVTSNGCRLTPVSVDPKVARGAVYALVHRETGRVYIGITRGTVARRWMQHRCPTSTCPKLRAALSKHGAAAFDVLVLAHGLTLDVLRQSERELVRLCQSDCEHGFNLTPGGDSCPMDHPEVRARVAAKVSDPTVKARRAASQRRAFAAPESKARRSAATRARYEDPSEVEKARAATKARYEDPSERVRTGQMAREALSRPDVKERHREAVRDAQNRPGVADRKRAAMLARYESAAERVRTGESIRRALANPEVRARLSASTREAQRARAPKYEWRHDDGRTFSGGLAEMEEAHAAERLSRSALGRLAAGIHPRYKGWRVEGRKSLETDKAAGVPRSQE